MSEIKQGQHRAAAMAWLHNIERQHAEEELRSALETLATCTTSAGDRWYNDEELEQYVKDELDDVFHCRESE